MPTPDTLRADYTNPATRRTLGWVDEYKARATAATDPTDRLANAQLATVEELGRIADNLEALVSVFKPAGEPTNIRFLGDIRNTHRTDAHDDDLQAAGDDHRDMHENER